MAKKPTYKELEQRLRDLREEAAGRKHAEEALIETQLSYRDLIESAPDLIQSVKPDGSFAFVNPAWLETLGYSEEELPSLNLFDIIHPDSLQHCQEAFSKAMSGQRVTDIQATFYAKDGREVYVEGSASPRFIEGEVIATHAIFRDHSERKLTQEAMERHVNDLVLLSKGATALVELPPEEDIYHVIGKHLKELIGDSIVFVSSFDSASESFCVRQALGLGEHMETVLKLLGRHPVGMIIPISDEAKIGLISGNLENVPGGLHNLSVGEIPKAICQTIEKLLGLGGAYAMGFAWGGELFGSTSFFMRRGTELKNEHTIETFIRQASVALQRKQADEALQESEARYRNLFDNSPTSLWEEDFSKVKEFLDDLRSSGVSNLRAYLRDHPDKTAHCSQMVDILDVNKATLDLFEAESNDEILGNLDKLFIEQSLEVFREELMTLHEGKGPFRGEIIGKSLRGNLIDCVIEVSIAPGYEDSWSKVLVSVTDITDRKVAEEALRESEERFRTILDFTYDWEFWIAPDGQFIYISPSCERVTGYSPEEFMNDPGLFEKIVHPDDHSMIISHIHGDQNLEELSSIDFRIITRSGEERWISHNCQPVCSIDGMHLGRRGSNRDISNRKQMEEDLLKVKKLESLSVLAGGIAHQFNNALSSITGHVGLLEMEYPEDEKITDYTKAMKESAHRMAHLTSQLLAFAGGGKYNPQPMSLSKLIEDFLPLIQHTLDPDIRVETDLPLDIMKIKADHTQIQMVFSAIIANSNEAIEGPGRIRVSTRNMDIDQGFIKNHPGLKPGPYVCLSIEDNGKGMDKETKEKIFEPFFTTQFIGRGLGMASVYGIVTNHNGSISVDSEPGKGAAVTIYLPALEAKKEVEGEIEEKIVPAPAIDLYAGEGTVLVIEDEEPLVKLFRQILERLGYRVLQARTGKEAVEIAKGFEGDIDFSILDIKLPDMSGNQVYPLIMEARPNLKVIVCTGYSIDSPAQEILDAGAQGFIQKPFSFKILAEKLKEVLEGK